MFSRGSQPVRSATVIALQDKRRGEDTMRRFVGILAVALVLGTTGQAMAQTDADLAAQVLALVNQNRQASGQAPLTRVSQLDQVAMQQVEHYDPSPVGDRLTRAGYAWRAADEIYEGQIPFSGLSGLVAGWMSDTSPDRQKLLSSAYTECGIAIHTFQVDVGGGINYSGALWCVDLGTRTAPIGPTDADLQARADQLFVLINQTRVQFGLAPLTRAPELEAAARAHSLDMAAHCNLDHTGSDGSDPCTRIWNAGYQFTFDPARPNARFYCAENLDFAASSAEIALSDWMNEPPDETGHRGHRETILNANLQDIGISVACVSCGCYWTADFGAH
jgi:uncharacterized protein YkwD